MTRIPEANSDAPESPHERRHSYFGLWFWALILLFVVYPLSIGPAKKIAVSHSEFATLYDAIYTPIVILCKTTDASKRALLWYFEEVWKIELATYR